MKRLKKIRRSEFEAVFVEDWEPVYLEGEAMPGFARGIPGAVRCCVIASGQDLASVRYPCPQLPGARIVGGIDVWRHSPDDPEPFNKDWYRVLESPETPDTLYVEGPHKDSEHHHPRIPERYSGVKVIGAKEDDD